MDPLGFCGRERWNLFAKLNGFLVELVLQDLPKTIIHTIITFFSSSVRVAFE